MWKINLQESLLFGMKNNPWVQHLFISLLIVLFLHWWYSSSSPRNRQRKNTDIPVDLLLQEEEITKTSRPARQKEFETSKIAPDTQDDKPAPKAITPNAEAAPSKQRKKDHPPQRTRPISATATTRILVPRKLPPFRRPPEPNRMHAYWHWHDTETSLFRVYEIAQRATTNSDSFSAIPPFTPSSRRGNVRVGLRVTNMLQTPMDVYWMDYQGREIQKGQIFSKETWHQTTWIDHPWVFRQREGGQLLLYFVPYRVIPTCAMASTVDENHENVVIQRFTIGPPLEDALACSVQDPILPFPARYHLMTSQLALHWALVHCTRMGFQDWELLLQCGTKIIQAPDEPKYRSFRIANAQFGPRLWNTSARGVLMAAGFYENESHVQFGSSTLGREEIQELSLWLWSIQKWIDQQQLIENNANQDMLQPMGADGYGRAGFGRAGQMNGNF